MTRKVTLNGFTFTDGNGISTPQATTLEITGTDDFRLQFIYDAANSNPAEGDIVGDVDVVQGDVFNAVLNGAVTLIENDAYDLSVERVTFSNGTGNFLIIGTETPQGYQLHVFRLTANVFSSEVPSRAELQSALQNVTVAPVTSGPFSGAFDPATIPNAVVEAFNPFNATEGNDTIIGLSSNDFILGLGGDDRLEGRDGNDTLSGGPGSDSLFGGNGNDLLLPGPGNSRGDYMFTGAGFDTIQFEDVTPDSYYVIDYSPAQGAINLEVDGQSNQGYAVKTDGVGQSNGVDRIFNPAAAIMADGLGIVGTNFDDQFTVSGIQGGYVGVRPGAGSDSINTIINGLVRLDLRGGTMAVDVNVQQGRVYNDGFGFEDTLLVIEGSGGFLEIRGSNFSDTLIGSFRNESFITEQGNDTVDGGGGIDRIRYDRAGITSVVVDLQAETATGVWGGQSFTDTLISIEQVRGSRDGNDLLQGDDNDNWLWGMGGDDTLAGRGGTNMLFGGAGNDTVILAGALVDATVDYHAEGIAISIGNSFNIISEVENFQFDDATLTLAQIEALLPPGEVIVGGAGDDSLVGTEAGDTIGGGAGADTLDGGGGDDVISGSTDDDVIFGGSGNDLIGGGTGDDTISGGTGDDTIGAGFGNDLVDGDEGNDVIGGGPGDDMIFGGAGNDTIGGSFGNDTIHGDAGDDSLGGGTGRDQLFGGEGADRIGGGEGDDTIFGGNGNDFLAGGGRDDSINGGDGNDTINGGAGNDTMFGGAGADLFIFNGFTEGEVDYIGDFEVGIDQIRLSGVQGQGLEGRFNALELTNITLNGGPAVEIEYQDHVIVLQGVRANELSVSDFIFIG